MAKLTLKDWLYAQHVPPEVMADIEKLFALPEEWRVPMEGENEWTAGRESCADELSSILGIEQSKR